MGLITFPLFAVTLQHVEKGHVGSASGVLESVQQLGSVFGVVLIGTAFFDHLVHGFSSAFTLAMELCIVALGAVTLISLILPRRFKAEEELDLA
jgi:MFS family permease